ncbi:hypothetical protein Y1Q_0011277 [Alligator mississippiensis]|uniref:Uncharacterized protein n=1 Tax=Alligator mississippiensis TaxID=8496 RepID=A0A151N800_ALLMI|nr:hypothetical protein Y1Q_0011277 [Alligator mississippiensis]
MEMPAVTRVATLPETGQRPQTLGALDTIEEKMVVLGAQFVECIVVAKTECQEQAQEFEVLKEALQETETQLETTQLEVLKPLEQGELSEYLGLDNPQCRAGLVRPEKSTMTKKSLGVDPMTMREEILPALMQYLDQRWEQLVNNHAAEMD